MALNHVLICVPTMAGLMKSKTATTLVMLMKRLTRVGIEADYLNIDSSDITYARNLYARLVLESEQRDGLIFIDSDMQFRPALILKMLAHGGDVVGAAYPKRSIDLGRFAAASRGLGDSPSQDEINRAVAGTYNYTVVPAWDRVRPEQLKVVKGFAKMAGVGMGCTVISRRALQAMIDGGVVERRKDIIDGVEQVGWGFFDPVKVGDVTLSEDYSFCYRWSQMLGRDLWVNIDEPITHIGEFPHQARYIDRLVLLRDRPPEAATAGPSTGVDVTIDKALEGEG
jgi:hypothetical protein